MNFEFLVPITYWLNTRLSKNSQKFQYILLTFFPQLLAIITFCKNDIFKEIIVFFLYYLGMIVTYELGYIENDYIAQRREIEVGITQKPLPPKVTLWIMIVGIFLRIILAILVGVIVFWYFNFVPIFYFIWLIILLVIFHFHNIILSKKRVITFGFLYFIRFLLPLVFVLDVQGKFGLEMDFFLQWFFFSVIYAFSYALAYGILKGFILSNFRYYLKKTSVVNIIVLIQLLLFSFCFTILNLIGVIDNLYFGVQLIFALLIYIIIWSVVKFIYSLGIALKRSKSELFHIHTNFSHDATILPEHLQKVIHKRNIRKIYITDHAEDFDEIKYEKLKKEYNDEHFIVGLEYSIQHHHILACSLKKFINLDSNVVCDALSKLKQNCNLIVWAHPRIAVRKLIQFSYLKILFEISSSVDGLEIYNRKNIKSLRSKIEIILISLIVIFIFGNKLFFLGIDAHRPEEVLKCHKS